MSTEEAVKVLRHFNEWRRYDGAIGEGPAMPDPKDIGIAIDILCDANELTWEDIKRIIAAEGSIYDEYHADVDDILAHYPTEEAFYGEVLRRYNNENRRND